MILSPCCRSLDHDDGTNSKDYVAEIAGKCRYVNDNRQLRNIIRCATSYYQEWEKGRRKDMQRSIKHFFLDSGLCAELTPSSNCLFVRSPNVRAIPAAKRRQLECACWPFHEAVIDQLGVTAILCMGGDAYKAVDRRFRDAKLIDEQPWSATQAHRAYRTGCGMRLCQLVHPSYGHWQCPKYNPASLVRRVLELDP